MSFNLTVAVRNTADNRQYTVDSQPLFSYQPHFNATQEPPQSTEGLAGLIPSHQCPRCLRLVDGRPWGGSDQLWAYACECGWQRVITSPAIAEAKERVREARLNRVGGAR
jgi:hypothetical protein